MEQIEREREFCETWNFYHPRLQQYTQDIYNEWKKKIEEYDVKRTTH